jgi:hypothetical protein
MRRPAPRAFGAQTYVLPDPPPPVTLLPKESGGLRGASGARPEGGVGAAEGPKVAEAEVALARTATAPAKPLVYATSPLYRVSPLFRPAGAAAPEQSAGRHEAPTPLHDRHRHNPLVPSRPADVRLRLFVCQKDEAALLAPWIDHALSLVARPGDVRIIDDDSRDPGVLATLRAAEAAGIDVVRILPPQPPAFRRKHMLFTDWVHQCGEEDRARGRTKVRASETRQQQGQGQEQEQEQRQQQEQEREGEQKEGTAAAAAAGAAAAAPGGCASEGPLERAPKEAPTCFFVPLDCDEFLAHRAAAPRPWEKLRLGRATLVLNTALSAQAADVRAALLGLAASGPGTWTIRRLRNFSHAEALFADVREHKWCGVNRKIVVCGAGRAALRHPLAIPDRGYHATVTGAQHGPAASLCLVEFHNLPYGLRQRKSLAMANLVPLHSRIKYRTEGKTSREDYETAQELAAHMQPTARSERFAAIMRHVFSPGTGSAATAFAFGAPFLEEGRRRTGGGGSGGSNLSPAENDVEAGDASPRQPPQTPT